MGDQFFLEALKVLQQADIEEFDFADGVRKFSFKRSTDHPYKKQSNQCSSNTAAEIEVVAAKEVSEYVVSSPTAGIVRRKVEDQNRLTVKIGDRIEEGMTVCFIEAMKMIIEVKAQRCGVLKNFFVTDGELVEYQQKLFVIE